jgi:hypothetical protein
MSELGGGEEIVEEREDRNVEIVGKVPGKRPVQALVPRCLETPIIFGPVRLLAGVLKKPVPAQVLPARLHSIIAPFCPAGVARADAAPAPGAAPLGPPWE